MIAMIAQAVGFVGLALVVISFQKNTNKGIVLFQMLAGATFVVHFTLLGTITHDYTGAMMNLVGVFRGVVFINRKKSWANHTWWLYAFIAIFMVSGILTWKNYFSLLPILGMCFASVGLWAKNPKITRIMMAVNSPCWMVFNIVNGSIAGICTELFAMSSLIIGIVRFDILKQEEKKKIA